MTNPEELVRQKIKDSVENCKKLIALVVEASDIEERKLAKYIMARYSPSIYSLAMMDLREENFFYQKNGIIHYKAHKDQLTLF